MSYEADRLAYLNYMATMANVAINTELLQLEKLIYEQNEKRNKELMEILKELKNEIKK